MTSAPMAQAIAVAQRARRLSPPNPWVGAVVVDPSGEVISSGFTQEPGGAHAEIQALAGAGERAQGSTLYVTLEPCCHQGRTGPCTSVIIDAGVARVVVGVRDPDSQVAGKGIDTLVAAGIAVDVGDGDEDIREQLAPYLWHRQHGRPFVILKMGATLDGRTAMADGSSQWITSADARRDVHELRADSDAIVVGAGTVRADNPELTARDASPRRDPRRVVLGTAPDGARIHPCDEFSGPLGDLLDQLGADGVLQLMVEGGAHVASDFLEAGLVNRVVAYVAPAVAGSEGGRGMFDGLRTPTMDALRRGRFTEVRRVGSDVRLELEL